jgi:hypothetical protein
MHSGWNKIKAKSETQRDRELREMSPDHVRKWALEEVHLALGRESIRAHHACKMDDCLRSFLSRMLELVQSAEMSSQLRGKFVKSISAHERMWRNATEHLPDVKSGRFDD